MYIYIYIYIHTHILAATTAAATRQSVNLRPMLACGEQLLAIHSGVRKGGLSKGGFSSLCASLVQL